MEWAVVWLSGARILALTIAGANGRDREREARRFESVPAPVEVRLQELGDRC